jgi:hypothetical protein
MPYVIGFGMRGGKGRTGSGERATACEAWELVQNLERRDEKIRFIRAPEGHEIGREELKVTADEEEAN